MPRKALLLEQDLEIQDWLWSLLRRAFPGVTISRTRCIGSAAALLQAIQPDISLLGPSFADSSGIEFVALAKSQEPSRRLAVVAPPEFEHFAHQAVDAGAVGYLLSSAPTHSLIQKLRLFVGPASFATEQHSRIGTHSNIGALSAREYEVLSRLAEGLPIGEIAFQLGVTRNTIDTFLKRAYLKLSANSAIQAIAHARQQGLLH